MHALRVIAGTARGRKLRSVPGTSTRPITDRTKESLFNIIGADIEGAAFLDLFGGTGSVGIEALSRGAAQALFFELDRRAIETIRANLELTGLGEQGKVQRGDAIAILEGSPQAEFDYVYIAPPQYKGLWKQALMTLDAHKDWLSVDAWAIAQIHPKEYEALNLSHLVEFDQRRYGSTQLVFYVRS